MLKGAILNYLIWLPILGAILVYLTGNDRNASRARVIALLVSLIVLLLCIPFYHEFNPLNPHMQFLQHINWMPSLGLEYALGVDGISVALIILSAFTTLIVVIASYSLVRERVAQYLAAFLLLEGFMIGIFAATNALLFYIFWEAALIPMYLIIGVWGSQNRAYAAIKFFLYTFLGSALMLVALLFMYHQTHSFAIESFVHAKIPLHDQILIFITFFLAFAVKVPMWPVHTWLPDAHTEAPAGGSVVLAAVLLKLGAYGFLRFMLPIVPDACRYLAWPMIILSLIAVIYIGFVALVQKDMKRLIAYSSISHMGMVTLGCFLFYLMGSTAAQSLLAMNGAVVQMISHAFTSGAMFIGIGVLYDRLHTRLIKDFGGVVNTMPVFASFFLFFAMANVGLPGTSGFVGEFMVIIAAFKANFWIAFLAALTIILAAAYTLWMYKRVFFGKVVNQAVEKLHDANTSEMVALILLAIPTLVIGVYPQSILHMFSPAVAHVIHLASQTKI